MPSIIEAMMRKLGVSSLNSALELANATDIVDLDGARDVRLAAS